MTKTQWKKVRPGCVIVVKYPERIYYFLVLRPNDTWIRPVHENHRINYYPSICLNNNTLGIVKLDDYDKYAEGELMRIIPKNKVGPLLSNFVEQVKNVN